MVCAAVMTKGKRFVFTVEPDLFEPLKAQAKKERRSIGSLLNYLAAKYLEEIQGLEIEPTIQHGGNRKTQLTVVPEIEVIITDAPTEKNKDADPE